MKTRAIWKKGQKLVPTRVGPGVINGLAIEDVAKAETPKGGPKIYNLDSLKHHFGPIKKID